MSTLHCLELVYSKNYFNLIEIFVLRLFEMVENQIGVSGCHQIFDDWEVQRMCNVHGEVFFSQKYFYKCAKHGFVITSLIYWMTHIFWLLNVACIQDCLKTSDWKIIFRLFIILKHYFHPSSFDTVVNKSQSCAMFYTITLAFLFVFLL